jgi:hypothetical protein
MSAARTIGGARVAVSGPPPAPPFQLCLSIAASAIVALIVALIGWALPDQPTLTEADEPVQIRQIESDLAEPFVVCATRAGVTRCQERDLRDDP